MSEMMVRKKLIEYLSDFSKRFSEMKELMRIANLESDQIYPLIGKLLDNAFIEDCDEFAVRKYERLLGIAVSEGDTLETRKSKVLLHWNNSSTYTYRNLIRQLDNYCSVNNYDIVPDLENYSFSLNLYGKAGLREINNFLEKVLPENIRYEVWQAHRFEGMGTVGIVWQDDEIFNLRQVIL